jgi:hypothetical protein
MPECFDVDAAPERASLAILIVALHCVEQALYVVHPTLFRQQDFESSPPRTLRLAAKIIDRCDKLACLIERYDQAVEDALGYDSDPGPF